MSDLLPKDVRVCDDTQAAMASTGIEEAKRAVVNSVRTFRRDGSADWDDERALRDEIAMLRNEIDVYLAIRGFSIDISAGDEEARQQAADALGWIGENRGISPLLRALADSDAAVRLSAAFALTQFPALPEWTVGSLARAVQDEDAGVRASAASALGCCRSRLAADAVVRGLDDAAAAVRWSAARALERLGFDGYQSDLAIAKLASVLADDEARVAYDAFWGLRGQAGSAADERCSAWRLSADGQRAWAEATSG